MWRVLLAVLVGAACAGSDQADRATPPIRSAKDEQGPRPSSARMVALAYLLSGSDVPNSGFSPEDESVARDYVFGVFNIDAHPSLRWTVKDPARCAVEREYLAYDGGVQSRAVVEMECDAFWKMIRPLDDYYEEWGYLPSSEFE